MIQGTSKTVAAPLSTKLEGALAETTPPVVRMPENPPPASAEYGGESTGRPATFDLVSRKIVKAAALVEENDSTPGPFKLVSLATVKAAALDTENDSPRVSFNLVSAWTVRDVALQPSSAEDVLAYARGEKKLELIDKNYCDAKPGYKGKSERECGVDAAFSRLPAKEFAKLTRSNLVSKDGPTNKMIERAALRNANNFLFAHVNVNDKKTDQNVSHFVASWFVDSNHPEQVESYSEFIRTPEGRVKFCQDYDLPIPKLKGASEIIEDPLIRKAANTPGGSNEQLSSAPSKDGTQTRIEAAHRDRKLAVLGAQEKINEQYQRSEHAKKVAAEQAAKIEDIRDATV